MDHRGRRRLLSRTMVTSLVACLFILQGLFLAVSSKFTEVIHKGAESSIITSADTQFCDVRGGDETPGPGSHNHAQCCIFCVAGARGAPFLALATLVSAVCAALEAIASVLHLLAEDPGGRPIDWTKTWSSRAPPSFS